MPNNRLTQAHFAQCCLDIVKNPDYYEKLNKDTLIDRIRERVGVDLDRVQATKIAKEADLVLEPLPRDNRSKYSERKQNNRFLASIVLKLYSEIGSTCLSNTELTTLKEIAKNE